MKFLLPLTIMGLGLAGCGSHVASTPEPIIITHVVNIPVVGACVPKELGDAPSYVDDDTSLKTAKDGAVRFQLLVAGRAQRTARLSELEPVVKGCPRAK